MKINFFKLKKNFKKKRSEINPNIYWNYLLYITLVFILCAFAFGLYIFMETNEDLTIQAVEEGDQFSKIKKERIDIVLEYFSKKKEKSFDILNYPLDIVDPSL
jgi:hypothetical protein